MDNFKVRISVDAGIMKVSLDGNKYLIVLAGETKEKSVQLTTGKHVVQWYVEGEPGTSYSAEIKTGDETTQVKKVLRPSGKDYGSFSFYIINF